MRNSMHKVSFTKTNTTIKEKRVKRYRCTLNYTARSSMCKSIWLTNNKCFKCQALIKRRGNLRNINFLILIRFTNFSRVEWLIINNRILNNYNLQTLNFFTRLTAHCKDSLCIMVLNPVTHKTCRN